jgi:hypothetical protein
MITPKKSIATENRAAAMNTTSSQLKQFLQRQNRCIKGSDTRKVTHVFMDQGRLMSLWTGRVRVEPLDIDQLYKAIAQDAEQNIMHPLVERFPDLARLAIDWDFKTEAELDEAAKAEYAQTAHRAVRGWLDREQSTDPPEVLDCLFTSVVCAPESLLEGVRTIEVEGVQLFKDGIHMVWPNLFVNHDQARHLLSNVILPALNNAHPDDGIYWAKALDASIYNAGKGLRLCYTVKRETCKECLEREDEYKKRQKACRSCQKYKPCESCKPELIKNNDCEVCKGSVVKLDRTEHHYVPICVLRPDGVIGRGQHTAAGGRQSGSSTVDLCDTPT